MYVRDSFTDTYRMLRQSQDDISTTDISYIASSYRGPYEAADMILSQGLLPSGISDATEDAFSFPPLAMALRSYAAAAVRGQAAESGKWETLMRKLIRKGSNLHVRVPSGVRTVGAWFPSQPTDYYTPLDELFAFTYTPAEAKSAADGWLRVLSSEGYGVVAYLKKEMDLHAPQHGLTFPSGRFLWEGAYDLPRQLIFVLDDSQPSVWWDWWVDPMSTTYLLRSEFKQMVMTSNNLISFFYTWEDTWPFTYPAWYSTDSVLPMDEEAKLQRLQDIAQRRANRRLQKAYAKTARLQGLRYPKMPGAWQE